MDNLSIETRILDPRIGKEFPAPGYATADSAGMDLVACLQAPEDIAPGGKMMVRSGVAMFIRNPGYMAMLTSRSGLSVKHGIILANSVGIIDADYQNEILVPLRNSGDRPYTIHPGERICQLIIVPIVQAKLKIVEDFSAPTDRGQGGFGSTGKF